MQTHVHAYSCRTLHGYRVYLRAYGLNITGLITTALERGTASCNRRNRTILARPRNKIKLKIITFKTVACTLKRIIWSPNKN